MRGNVCSCYRSCDIQIFVRCVIFIHQRRGFRRSFARRFCLILLLSYPWLLCRHIFEETRSTCHLAVCISIKCINWMSSACSFIDSTGLLRRPWIFLTYALGENSVFGFVCQVLQWPAFFQLRNDEPVLTFCSHSQHLLLWQPWCIWAISLDKSIVTKIMGRDNLGGIVRGTTHSPSNKYYILKKFSLKIHRQSY